MNKFSLMKMKYELDVIKKNRVSKYLEIEKNRVRLAEQKDRISKSKTEIKKKIWKELIIMKSGDYDFYIVNFEFGGEPFEISVLLPPDLTDDEIIHQVKLQVRKYVLNQTIIQSHERVDKK